MSTTTSPPAPTITQREQFAVESQVGSILNHYFSHPQHEQSLMSILHRDKHLEYLIKGLKQLGPSFSVLDANRPWLCYWILHSIALLGESNEGELEDAAVEFLSRCQDQHGGYGGGPGQMPHLATTYAAVNSLITLGGEKALSSINRDKLREFLLRMKDPCGGFRMHNAGEMDVRACYTAISVASVLNILDDELAKNVGNYILSCQTYEGGIGGEPGTEAHGGYTFCGLATMILINEADRLDLPSLLHWVAFRQSTEFGFQGRANKLVDGCYSFWQGGVFALIQRLPPVQAGQLKLNSKGSSSTVTDDEELSDIGLSYITRRAELGPLFQTMTLQQYILWCSQVEEGGFRDKPGKYRDYYHTCYCLSGLSVAQHCYSVVADSSPRKPAVLGSYSSNRLKPVHPLYNVVLDRYFEAHEYFCES
ncbi:protein farnesyltransferase [Ranunculus cassubicifolius]